MSEENKEAPLPFEQPGWWKSRKFIGAVISTVALWGVAIATGGLSVPVALAASSPLLGWIGVEGVVDAVKASRK